MISGRLLFVLVSLPSAAIAQSHIATGPTAVLPAGTQLPVAVEDHLPMKVGTPIRARLLYRVYQNDQPVLPEGTIVLGKVVSLNPDRRRRTHARLGGDFTPLRTPVVQFTEIVLPSGAVVPIVTSTATDGAPILRLESPPPRKGGFIAQQFATVKQLAKDRVAVFTGPDKADRATQFVYSQLPYHPQRIAKATAWTVETAQPVTLPYMDVSPNSLIVPPAQAAVIPAVASRESTLTHEDPKTWMVQAYLADAMSSKSSKAGDAIKAIVAEPILAEDGGIAVPQGSLLTGTVTQARPARKFSRAGELRFSFTQLTLPGQETQSVRASLAGADTASDQDLAMTSEGEVKPKPHDKVVVPAILLVLAFAPLHHDHKGEEHQVGKDAAASNSLGLIAFIVGTASQQPYLASGFGYYGAALSIYQRIFSKGKEVSFARDTRVVIETMPTRSHVMRAAAAQP